MSSEEETEKGEFVISKQALECPLGSKHLKMRRCAITAHGLGRYDRSNEDRWQIG